jgi:hypothetical protein
MAKDGVCISWTNRFPLKHSSGFLSRCIKDGNGIRRTGVGVSKDSQEVRHDMNLTLVSIILMQAHVWSPKLVLVMGLNMARAEENVLERHFIIISEWFKSYIR